MDFWGSKWFCEAYRCLAQLRLNELVNIVKSFFEESVDLAATHSEYNWCVVLKIKFRMISYLELSF